jgi:hypothetical protein
MSTKTRQGLKLSTSNWLHLLICLGLLAILLVAVLRPTLASFAATRRQVEGLRGKMAEHNALVAFAARLDGAVVTGQGEAARSPFKPVALKRRQLGEFQSALRSEADACGLVIEQATPSVVSLDDHHRYLNAHLKAAGAFGDMRRFVEAMLATPSFFHLEQLRIDEGAGGERIELSVWFVVE